MDSFTDEDLDAAVQAGVLDPKAAQAFRAFVAQDVHRPGGADEERFRLLTGFNDVFVSVALVLFFMALGWLGYQLAPAVAAAGLALTSWPLALLFTRRRRLALPSILLLFTFVGGVAWTLSALLPGGTSHGALRDLQTAVPCAGAAVAAYVHWRVFRVPITVAAGTVALGGTIVTVLFSVVPALQQFWTLSLLLLGLGLFATAMWWDLSDRSRITRRSDVAFWLHLSAAPAIVHPVFSLIRLRPSEHDVLLIAGVILLIYVLLTLVALVIDRRALLVSALAYVVGAVSNLIQAAGTFEAGVPLAGLVIGSALLLLSAWWTAGRRRVVHALPGRWQAALPPA